MTTGHKLRLAFFGTPDFAVPALGALKGAGHEILRVYTQPPRPAGRGQAERKSAVQLAAEKLGLPVAHHATLNDAGVQRDFAALKADAAVVVAYGLILPPPVLDATRLGCVNIHASLLPRWRGAAPIQRAILAGDRETGVCIMRMDIGLDTGPVLLHRAIHLDQGETAGMLHDKLASLGAHLVVVALEGLSAGTLEAVPQPTEGATYAQKIDKAETRLDWKLDAAQLERCVRAFAPHPGAWFELPAATHAVAERVRVLSATVVSGARGQPGTLLDEALTVACGRGALRPLVLQRAGKLAMPHDAFLRGHKMPAGTVLA